MLAVFKQKLETEISGLEVISVTKDDSYWYMRFDWVCPCGTLTHHLLRKARNLDQQVFDVDELSEVIKKDLRKHVTEEGLVPNF